MAATRGHVRYHSEAGHSPYLNAGLEALVRLVEDTPFLSRAALRAAGLFASGSPSQAVVEVGDIRVGVTYRPESKCLVLRFARTARERVEATIMLETAKVGYGEKLYLICPIDGSRRSKLYLVGDRWGSAGAHGLVHFSRARPSQYYLGKAPTAERRKHIKLPDDTGTLMGLDGGRALLEQMAPTFLSRAAATDLFGHLGPEHYENQQCWASTRPRIDSYVLAKAGLLRPGMQHRALMSWPTFCGLVTADFDLRYPDQPVARISLNRYVPGRESVLYEIGGQDIALEHRAHRWYFVDRSSGLLCHILYLRNARFGDRKAQRLDLAGVTEKPKRAVRRGGGKIRMTPADEANMRVRALRSGL